MNPKHTRPRVTPWALGAVLILTSCRTAPTAPREPANLPSAHAVTNVATSAIAEVYRDTVAETAVVMSAPNSHGEQLPLCRTALIDRPHLVPPYFKVTTSRHGLSLNLPTCSVEQEKLIFDVAAHAAGPRYAAVGGGEVGQLILRCGINFAAAASIMAAYTSVHNASAPESAVRRVSPRAGLSAGMIVASAVQATRPRKINDLAHLYAAFSCTGFGGLAGQAVVYLITPAKP